MKLIINGDCWHKMNWLAERSENELTAMGVIIEDQDDPSAVRLIRLEIMEQKVSPAHIEIDGDHLAKLNDDLFLEGFEPWQLCVWFHTHPEGMAGPSGTDTNTMEETFGDYAMALMLILPKKGKLYSDCYCRLKATWIPQQVVLKPEVEIDYLAWDTAESADKWEADYEKHVSDDPSISVSLAGESFSSMEKTSRLDWWDKPEGYASEVGAYEDDYANEDVDDDDIEEYFTWCDASNLAASDLTSYTVLYGQEPSKEFKEKLDAYLNYDDRLDTGGNNGT